MVGGVGGDVGDGVVQTVHHRHSQNVIEKFGVEVRIRSRRTVDDGGGAAVKAQLHRLLPGGDTLVHQRPAQHRQELVRHGGMDKADLLGVADGGAAGLGVGDDPHRLFQIGGSVHVDMADAGARFDAGNGGVLHTGTDQSRAAPGDQQIHQPAGLHDVVGALVAGILHDVDDVRIAAGGGDAVLQRAHDGAAGAVGLPPAAEHTDIAALDGQRRRVGGDVGTALIDDGHQSQRHLYLGDGHAVGAGELIQHTAGVIGQRGGGANAVGHGADAPLVQPQTIQHDGGDMPLRVRHILPVGVEDGGDVELQRVRHGQQEAVFLLLTGGAQCGPRGLRPLQKLYGGHITALPVRNLVPTGLPSAMSYSTSGLLPLAMTISQPAAVAMAAARSLVTMPPVPRPVLLSSASV